MGKKRPTTRRGRPDELADEQLDAVSGGAGLDGISYLVAVTQMKTDNANDDALAGADRQRELVDKRKLPR